jgi:hypothetical protein
VQPDPQTDPILVRAAKVNQAANVMRSNPLAGITSPLLSQFSPDEVADAAKILQNETQNPDEIKVTANKGTPVNTSGTPIPVPPIAVSTPPAPTSDIVVTANKTTKPQDGAAIGGATLADIAKLGTDVQSAVDANAAKEKPESDLDKALKYMRLAGLGSTLLGAVGGSGGGDGAPLTPGGGGYNASNVSGVFAPRAARGIGFDPFTYGQAGGDQPGEYLFFDQIAQPVAAPAAPAAAFKDGGEADGDMVKHLTEWHKGGGHTGPGQVKGIGSGQEDKIPAWLSDGEYVWSAQDVADLGDGSTDEGVRRLDKMRHMVRRRAGRKDVKKIAKPQQGIDTMLKAVGGSV